VCVHPPVCGTVVPPAAPRVCHHHSPHHTHVAMATRIKATQKGLEEVRSVLAKLVDPSSTASDEAKAELARAAEKRMAEITTNTNKLVCVVGLGFVACSNVACGGTQLALSLFHVVGLTKLVHLPCLLCFRAKAKIDDPDKRIYGPKTTDKVRACVLCGSFCVGVLVCWCVV